MMFRAILVLPLLSVISQCPSSPSASPQTKDPVAASDPSEDETGRDTTSSASPGRPTPARGERPETPKSDAPTLDPEAQAFLDAHNQARANVSPAPSKPMPALRWSDELAAHAKKVAGQCKFEHSKTDYGENLSGRTGPADPAEVVADWVAEVEHWDAKRNKCDAGEVCGHYTQVVWAATTDVGCASNHCGKGGPFGDTEWTMTVCNYSPAGNFSGQRPY